MTGESLQNVLARVWYPDRAKLPVDYFVVLLGFGVGVTSEEPVVVRNAALLEAEPMEERQTVEPVFVGSFAYLK